MGGGSRSDNVEFATVGDEVSGNDRSRGRASCEPNKADGGVNLVAGEKETWWECI